METVFPDDEPKKPFDQEEDINDEGETKGMAGPEDGGDTEEHDTLKEEDIE